MPSVTALNDQFAVQPGVATTLAVLANDSNPDGTGLQVIAHTAVTPAGPTLADNGDGTFTFTSAAPGTFTFDYTVTGDEHKLANPDAAAEDQFGNSVAISGDTVVVGAFRNNEGDAGDDEGAAYVFVRSSTGWSHQQKLTIPDPDVRDHFGYSVSVSGDTVVVGAIDDDQVGEDNAGAVYVYFRSGTAWSLQQKLPNPDPAVNDNFGYSVAVSGDNVVVGVRNDDEGAINAGAAYVYARSGTAWSLQQKITNPAPADFDHFGDVVATSGDTVVVGAYADDEGDAGAAYLYVWSGTAWSLQQKFPNPDPEGNDYFGSAVALSVDTVVVGALGDNFGGDAAGAAYVYVRTGTNWTLQQKITNPNPAVQDLFGSAVAVSGDTVVVGAHADDEGATDAGAAYVYARTGTNWTLQQILGNPDPALDENFGWAVAVSGETVVVGTINDNVGGNYGAGSISLRNVTQDTTTVTISVTNVNEAPTITVPGVQSVFEDVDNAISGISVGDPEGDSLTLTLTVSHGTLTLGTTSGLTVTGNGSGSLSLSGSLANLNAALAALVYRGTLNFSGADTLNITANDGSLATSASVAITMKSAANQAADLQARVNSLRDSGALSGFQALVLRAWLDLRGTPVDILRVRGFLLTVDLYRQLGILTQTQADDLLSWGNILLLGVTRR